MPGCTFLANEVANLESPFFVYFHKKFSFHYTQGLYKNVCSMLIRKESVHVGAHIWPNNTASFKISACPIAGLSFPIK